MQESYNSFVHADVASARASQWSLGFQKLGDG